MSFNITKAAIGETSIVHLIDPATDMPMYADAAEKQPLTIEIFGKASKQYRSALATLSRKQEARGKKKVSFAEQIADNDELLAAVTHKASNFDMGDGVPLTTKAQFVILYSTQSLYWIKDQVSAELENVEGFLQK